MKKPCLLEGALKWPLSLTVSRVAFRAAARLDSKQLELDGLDGLRRLLDVKLEEAIERIEKKEDRAAKLSCLSGLTLPVKARWMQQTVESRLPSMQKLGTLDRCKTNRDEKATFRFESDERERERGVLY